MGSKPWRSLLIKNGQYRLLLFGFAVDSLGLCVGETAAAWLVARLTHSGLLVGVTTASLGLSNLALLLAGGWIERFNRRRLILCAQLVAALPGLALFAMLADRVPTPWFVVAFGFALARAMIFAVEKPIRRTIVKSFVASGDLTTAVGLIYSMGCAALAGGAALDGALISSVGASWCFLISAICCPLTAVMFARLDPGRVHARATDSVSSVGLRHAVGHVRASRRLRVMLAGLALTATILLSLSTLQPILAVQMWHGSPRAYAALQTVTGVGLTLGGVAAGQRERPTPRYLIALGFAMGGCAIAVGQVGLLAAQLVLVGALTLAWGTFQATVQATVLTEGKPHIGAMAMRLYAAVIGTASVIGNVALGALADALSARVVITLGGLTLLAANLAATALRGHRGRT